MAEAIVISSNVAQKIRTLHKCIFNEEDKIASWDEKIKDILTFVEEKDAKHLEYLLDLHKEIDGLINCPASEAAQTSGLVNMACKILIERICRECFGVNIV